MVIYTSKTNGDVLKSLYHTLDKYNSKEDVIALSNEIRKNIYTTENQKLCLFFYNYMKEAEDYISSIDISYEIIDNKSRENILNSYFLHHDIKKDIERMNNSFTLYYHIKIKEKDIYIYIPILSSYNNNDMNNNDIFQFINETEHEVKFMCIMLYIVFSLQENNCNDNKLKIYFIKTKYTKTIHNMLYEHNKKETYLTQKHINSAFTRVCSKDGMIVIYRKEEWFKVFIHEVMHSFGLHSMNGESNLINREISKYIGLNITILVDEAYAEFWGRILNSMFISYFNHKNNQNNKNNQYNNFYNSYNSYLEIEILYSFIQKKRIYKYYNLKSNDYSKYKEVTNIFSYYILTSLFMTFYNDTISFFNTENNNKIQSVNNKSYIEKYIHFVKLLIDKEKHMKSNILYYFENINIDIFLKENKCLRMSIIE